MIKLIYFFFILSASFLFCSKESKKNSSLSCSSATNSASIIGDNDSAFNTLSTPEILTPTL